MSESSIRVEALVDKGCDLFDAGDFDAALDLFLEAYNLGETWVGLNIGNTLERLGRLEDAVSYLEAAGESDPDSLHNLAILHEKMGDATRARQLYETLAADDYSKARYQLAWLEHDQDPARAESLMRSVLDDESVGELAAGVLGHWLWHEGREGAAILLEEGKDAYPSARADLADALTLEGREAEAVALLEAGLAEHPEDFSLPLARRAEASGDLLRAEQLYRRGAAAGDAHSMENLAIMLEEQGRDDEAKEWWDAAQEAGVTDSKRSR